MNTNVTSARGPLEALPLPRRWEAELDLGFGWQDGGTVLRHRRHVGPLRVQKPFYPEGREVCHVYVLHPPGGLVGGDRLEVRLRVGGGAKALLTTPAAGKVYRTCGEEARQSVHAVVEEGAALEWLPQETIIYSGASARLCTRIDMDAHAQVSAWEITCLGRPASAERFDEGACRSHLDVYKQGLPLVLERACFLGASSRLTAAWGLSGHAASGTFLVHPATQPALEVARLHCHGVMEAGMASATLVDETLVCRAVAADATLVRERFVATWKAVLPLTTGRAAKPPRIWAT